ncbi:serine/threonine protein kinase [Rivularia sp. PCC 7116]|uniref:serine/threonine-protein kinase n=1 Tax=Rivularia sp. PCC 7116 TaxID=373994 RepID=UPI00029EE4D3|nr:serine/threonine-protein kinase [Rivularia sp. PCC 7116]AFY53763.1 serine/threonine protein kinase [Rivularia sp. PCC 7116]
MEIYCTRPQCPHPQNHFADLDNNATLRTANQKYCTACGMPLILAGRYLPIKLLGRGGFGAAFLSRDRYTPGMRQCVVKQFLPAGNLSPTQLKLAQDLFEREAVVLEEIGSQHEQIPDLFAFFPVIVPGLQTNEQNQFFYLVQEHIDGDNLEEELVSKGKFSVEEVLFLLHSILPVLQFVHDKGIIHRDIKPSNIMRHRNGKLFLLDFGAVKQVANSPSGAGNSSTGIYSLGFAPPEQMSGAEVFPSTDLYALAVTVILLLTGQKNVTELFDAYSNKLQWQDKVQVSPHFAEILEKMLRSAPSQRFQSAEEVWAALDESAQPLPETSLNYHQPQAISQPQPPPLPKPSTKKYSSQVAEFSTLELLAGSAFSGFEGTLISIAFLSLLQSPPITFVTCAVIIGILVFAQTRRWIEKWDLVIIPAISLLIMIFIPLLQGGLGIQGIVILSLAASLVAVALTSLFRLIYKILSSMI